MSRSPQDGARGLPAGIWLCVLVLLAAVASALLVGGARSASQQEGLIAFTRLDAIYVMRPDGGGVRLLRRGGVTFSAYGLAWSPDGRKLAFADRGIWVVNADGTKLRHLLTGRMTTSPTWSPDGRRIAFGTWSEIRVVNTDGSSMRRLRTNPGSPARLDWSPAGGRIAFSFFDFYPAVYVMDTSGRNVRRLAHGWDPDWSPDGRRIAFVGYDRGISVMNARGRNVQRVTEGSDPEWSPDGRRIAFVRGEEIYVMNADGTAVTRLTHDQVADGNPAWQPVAPTRD